MNNSTQNTQTFSDVKSPNSSFIMNESINNSNSNIDAVINKRNRRDSFSFKMSKINEQKKDEQIQDTIITQNKSYLKNLFETNTLEQLYKGMDEKKQKMTSALIRQMTKKIEEMDDEFMDDEIKNLCQLNMLDVNLKEEIKKMETVKNDTDLDAISEEDNNVEMDRLGAIAYKHHIHNVETIKQMKDYSYLLKPKEKKIIKGKYGNLYK